MWISNVDVDLERPGGRFRFVPEVLVGRLAVDRGDRHRSTPSKLTVDGEDVSGSGRGGSCVGNPGPACVLVGPLLARCQSDALCLVGTCHLIDAISSKGACSMEYSLGIDVACRAAHVATLSDSSGKIVWSNHRFRTTTEDLDRLWRRIPSDTIVTVVIEPTRNAWVPLAVWLRAHGAVIVLVPPQQSADLRRYYERHTKNDRLDSVILSRLPLLHPDGLILCEDVGPADPLRRAVRRRARLVERRIEMLNRLTALIELLGPGYLDLLGSNLTSKTSLTVLERYADPVRLRRVPTARLIRIVRTVSRGHHKDAFVAQLRAAAGEAIALYGGGELDFAELADDIATEVRLIRAVNDEIVVIDARIATLYSKADPAGIVASVPGIGSVLAPAILGRLGDPARFASLAAVRAFTGLVPDTNESGISAGPVRLTKAGDPGLRTALFMAADLARQTDPTLAAKYRRLVVEKGKHHNSAICHLATTLVTRIAACLRTGTPYQLRDVDGTPISQPEGRQICDQRYRVKAEERPRRTPRPQTPSKQTGRVQKEVA